MTPRRSSRAAERERWPLSTWVDRVVERGAATGPLPNLVARYALPVIANAAALVLGLLLEPTIEDSPLLPFLAAVAVSAWYGGLGSGLLATAIGGLVNVYFFLVPVYSLEIANLNAAVQVVTFALVAFLISSLSAHLRDAHRRAEVTRADVEAAHARLSFLAEASAALDRSLDYEDRLKNLARVVVPALADWCVVHVAVEDGGSLRRAAVVSGGSDGERLAREMQECVLGDSEAPGIRTALSTGLPVVYPGAFEALRSDGSYDSEHLRLLRTLGFRSAMIVPLVAGGRPIGALTLVSAETERRYGAAEKALVEDLARRAALAIENARLYREARQAIQVRNEFLATISHDLANPLSVIRGQVQLYQQRAARACAADRAWLLDGVARIDTSTMKAIGMIGQLLDVARLQSGRSLELQRQPVDLPALVRRVVAEHQRAVRRPVIRAETSDARLIGVWDETRLERVVANLLENAIKYSPEPAEIVVRVAREERVEGRSAIVSVQDRGIGIPEKELPRVFERFYRASNVARRIRGSGIGLAGVRQIVEQHGGTVVLESKEGEGTTVTVRLPLSGEREQHVRRDSAADGTAPAAPL
jgi:K+-sensing histidine kinase KdpD